ncbi:hypothetical protein PFISCL1PPCAC_4627, partial [Pristionchus fissidentatus]
NLDLLLLFLIVLLFFLFLLLALLVILRGAVDEYGSGRGGASRLLSRLISLVDDVHNAASSGRHARHTRHASGPAGHARLRGCSRCSRCSRGGRRRCRSRGGRRGRHLRRSHCLQYGHVVAVKVHLDVLAVRAVGEFLPVRLLRPHRLDVRLGAGRVRHDDGEAVLNIGPFALGTALVRELDDLRFGGS